MACGWSTPIVPHTPSTISLLGSVRILGEFLTPSEPAAPRRRPAVPRSSPKLARITFQTKTGVVGIKNGVPMGLSESLYRVGVSRFVGNAGFVRVYDDDKNQTSAYTRHEFVLPDKAKTGLGEVGTHQEKFQRQKELYSGYELHYSSTHGEAPSITDTAAQLTNATKTLIMAMPRRKPFRVSRKDFRVSRKDPSENNRLYPSIRYRYRHDGLYARREQRSCRKAAKDIFTV
ncbi:hypothetical protein K440DRAFT_638923 [Wilcoxina mikolae CBS 423.85]|nr:hypothetical protein K440DRAFT_638923 [Wilcoxina mikolae CBS 423.85]